MVRIGQRNEENYETYIEKSEPKNWRSVERIGKEIHNYRKHHDLKYDKQIHNYRKHHD